METVQLGLRFDKNIVENLRYMAWFNRESLTDTIIAAWASHIQKFESENGQITPDQIAEFQKKQKKGKK